MMRYRVTHSFLCSFRSLSFFLSIAGAVTPIYESRRIVVGFDIFFITVVNAAVMYVLWPTHAQDAFRVTDGSSASAMLSLGFGDVVGGEDGTNFHSALDEAYAYTSFKEPAASSNAQLTTASRAGDYEYRGPL